MIIPLPSAIDNHQLLNAKNIVNLDMGLINEESQAIESLTQKLQKVIETKVYEQWSNKESNLDHFQAAARMLSSILKF